MKHLLTGAMALTLLLLARPAACAVGPEVRQLVVALSPDWDSMHGRLQCFERTPGGPWKPALGPVPVLFGKNGLAWGRGLEGTAEPGYHKAERDGRAPAGVFEIGKVYTYDPALPEGSGLSYHQVTTADAWVDDPKLPNYNKFVTIPDPAHPPDWFEKMKMRHGDFAYRWLVEIRHNSDPPQAGAGSAIFFHIRRGENRPTSGCTTMAEANLENLIRWLRASDHPQYVLLPREEYQRKWQAWGLPDPALLAAE